LFSFSSFWFFLKQGQAQVDKQEAQKAFILLNKIRTTPSAFTVEMPFLAEIEKKAR
jgi:hypothetical protein